ncbi:uncharacterized protein FOBCDRAFT_202864 [Fusarium oxysporum Fo47]|uniref:uncharacterized protein n=1 Tax=Fusarium oxysporum Fo47 TaxID=660027 RepID=UPI002869B21F|nr:uncharacterized protein FOBCDRAFT_202864 [Fusarium oxysporum Fo47]QKD55751.2 hypothetical protein FOBCDRAFT_202864 [Fusarium oxysporum Fo47]
MQEEPGPAERLIGEDAKIAIYFGAMDGGEIGPTVEFVHAEAVHLTCPEFLKRVTKWGIISLPFAPADTINAMFTLRQDVEEAYDLAIHVYSQAVYSDITKMKDQATEYMTSLFPYMEPTLMLAYTYSVLEPLYPELNFKWVEVQARLVSNYEPNDRLMEVVEAERQADVQRFKESLARRENAWVKINGDGQEEESSEESGEETEVEEATEVESDEAAEGESEVEETEGEATEAEDTEAQETGAETEAGTDDESYDSNGKLRIIGDDGLINLDLANYPPGVYRWTDWHSGDGVSLYVDSKKARQRKVPIFNCWDLFRDNGYRFAVMHQRYRVEVEGLIFPLLLHLQKTTEILYHFKKMYQPQHVGPL